MIYAHIYVVVFWFFWGKYTFFWPQSVTPSTSKLRLRQRLVFLPFPSWLCGAGQWQLTISGAEMQAGVDNWPSSVFNYKEPHHSLLLDYSHSLPAVGVWLLLATTLLVHPLCAFSSQLSSSCPCQASPSCVLLFLVQLVYVLNLTVLVFLVATLWRIQGFLPSLPSVG